jgi:hypothetical protein
MGQAQFQELAIAMRRLLTSSFVGFCCLCQAASVTVLDSIVGPWQFPDRSVWVEIKADGSAFQCRRAPSGTIYTSKGSFVPPDMIVWLDIWGTDKVSRVGETITLTGKWGSFSYGKPTEPMSDQCSSVK